ncbi:hypothetical protein [Fontibacillus sp. BL9]|uniref:hypothetical protein n=1 Tax=Fontibacillus sp. BL9 TaxID=3389971 RepID=UPI00397A9BB5
METVCGSVQECTDNPCGNRKTKYKHNYGWQQIEPVTVTCAVFGYPGDGVCYSCSKYLDSEYVSCC